MKWYVVGVEAALISVNHSVLRVYIGPSGLLRNPYSSRSASLINDIHDCWNVNYEHPIAWQGSGRGYIRTAAVVSATITTAVDQWPKES